MIEFGNYPTLLLADFLMFSAVMSFTPGPNNIMLATSGAAHGFRATVPLVLGVTVGFPVMLIALGGGISMLFAEIRWLQPVMRVLSLGYMLWLAYRIATASTSDMSGAPRLSFWQAAGFQWINPKAWVIALVTLSAYTVRGPGPLLNQILLLAALSMVVGLASCLAWAGGGAILSRWIDTPARRATFNWTMGLLLIACALPMALAPSISAPSARP